LERLERRVTELKTWRTKRSKELALDPGVLCPNAALEAIAWRNPKTGSDLEDVPELKGWFVREFGDEVSASLTDHATDAEGRDAAADDASSVKAKKDKAEKGEKKSGKKRPASES
jgi:ribonuclease D